MYNVLYSTRYLGSFMRWDDEPCAPDGDVDLCCRTTIMTTMDRYGHGMRRVDREEAAHGVAFVIRAPGHPWNPACTLYILYITSRTHILFIYRCNSRGRRDGFFARTGAERFLYTRRIIRTRCSVGRQI